MKFKNTFSLLALILFLSISPSVQAESVKTSTLNEVTPATFDELYTKVTTRLAEIEKTAPRFLLKQANSSKGKHVKRLNKEQTLLLKEYKALTAQNIALKPMSELRQALINLYKDKYKSASYDESLLKAEATHLSVKLIQEIAVLKKKYKSIFIPIVHNMMIDIGVRKRGACKHWAEDLLEFMKPMDRKFFDVTWGESNPEKFTEHNVAVILPKGGVFNDGMMIDPWRTSGNPFWLKVTEDTHFHWQQWAGYGYW